MIAEGFEALKNQDKLMKDMETSTEYIESLLNDSNNSTDVDFFSDVKFDIADAKNLFYFYEVVKRYAKEYHLEPIGSEVLDCYAVKYEGADNKINHLEIGCMYDAEIRLTKCTYYCKKLDEMESKTLDKKNILDFNKVIKKNQERQLSKKKRTN